MHIDELGHSGRFEELLQLLHSAGYNDDFICARFHLRLPDHFELDRKKRPPLPEPECAPDILTALFLACESTSLATAVRILGGEAVALLESMGLLVTAPGEDRCHASAALYPVGDIYIASDRWSSPDGAAFTAPDDIVYPAFIPNTRLLLRHLPKRPQGDFLDLCAGTGAAALAAAKNGAGQAWSADIADRSTRFAEFNRRLNGLNNVHPVTSDLYDSLEARSFDFIAAHPPYVPVSQPKWIFLGGGRDGEEITRRIVAGLPDRLNEGGVFLALTMGSDRGGHPFEKRLREWLGPAHANFDIALIVRRELDPREFARDANRTPAGSGDDSEAWHKWFTALGVTSLVYGFVIIRRRSGAGAAFTVRRQAAAGNARAPWEWLLRWEAAAAGDGLARLILDSPLHASRRTEFEVVHRMESSGWTPTSYKLRAGQPFRMECEAQPWMAHLLSLCDGRATGRDVLSSLKQHGAVPGSTMPVEFAQAAAALVSGGFLEVEGFRPPREGE